MIYFLCLKNIYEKYYEYIDTILINKNNYELILLNYNDELFININNYYINNKLLFNNIIFFIIHPINENFINYINTNLKKIDNNLDIKKFLYFLNLNNLNLNNDILENLSEKIRNNILKYDINTYINYLCNNYLYIDDNYQELMHSEKVYDIAIVGNVDCDHKKIIYEKLKNNNINVNIIEGFGDKTNELLFKHKILLNLTNGKEYNLLNHINCNKCLFNRMLVINEEYLDNENKILDNFILRIKYNFIDIFINFIISNYKNIYSRIFDNFNIKEIKKAYIGIKTSLEYIIEEPHHNYGFIIIRHVNSEKTNNYWIECYKSIRQFYNNKIIIIDDNSNYEFIKFDELKMFNYEIVQSEYNTSGEILAYYYFYKNKYFEKAIIIHDSVFIQKYIDFNKFNNIKYIWHFTHDWDIEEEELDLLKSLNKNKVNELIEFYYNKDKWYGSFGTQSIIDYTFLEKIVNKYDLFNLIDIINDRKKRMNFERIFGLLCCYENSILKDDPSMLGIIHHYIHWGYTYEAYLNEKNTSILEKYELIKVWTGR